MEKINGFIAAPFTPMHKDGSLNLEKIRDYAKFYYRNRIDGAFICGTSGEGFLLSLEERKKVAEKWVNESHDNFKTIIHVGGPGIDEGKQLAKHARNIGVWGFGTMGPVFFKPSRVKELVDFCEELAKTAPDLPFYYYHSRGKMYFSPAVGLTLYKGSGRIPNLAGIKYTHEDMHEFNQCIIVENGKYDILHGRDETLIAGLAMGATGGVGGTYNHIMGLYIGMKEAFLNGDIDTARELQLKSQKFINILRRYRGNVIGGKRIMKFLGLDCGPNRLPIQNITDEEEKNMKTELEEIGFFKFCNK